MFSQGPAGTKGPAGTSLNHLAGWSHPGDWRDGAGLRPVGGPADRLTGAAYSPDGRPLAVTGNDADIRLWELANLLGAEARP
jgi:hypothetical protein